MKTILQLLILLTVAQWAHGQAYQKVYTPIEYSKIRVTKILGIPSDTAYVRQDPVAVTSPNLAVVDTLLMLWDPSNLAWKTVGKISGSGLEVQWGNITGDIQAQADLIALLDQKEPLITASDDTKYYRGDKTWAALDTALWGIGDARYLKLSDTALFGEGGALANPYTFRPPIYVNQGEVTLDFGVPTYNANKLQGYPVTPGEPAHGAYLIYDSVDQRWESGVGAGATLSEVDPVFTAQGVPKTRQLTINGTTHDLAADASWTITDTNFGNTNITATGSRTHTFGSNTLTMNFNGTNGSNAVQMFDTKFSTAISRPSIDRYSSIVHTGTTAIFGIESYNTLTAYNRINIDEQGITIKTSPVLGASLLNLYGDTVSIGVTNGKVKLGNLAGTGTRPLEVLADGTVQTGTAGGATTLYTGNGTIPDSRQVTVGSGASMKFTNTAGTSYWYFGEDRIEQANVAASGFTNPHKAEMLNTPGSASYIRNNYQYGSFVTQYNQVNMQFGHSTYDGIFQPYTIITANDGQNNNAAELMLVPSRGASLRAFVDADVEYYGLTVENGTANILLDKVPGGLSTDSTLVIRNRKVYKVAPGGGGGDGSYVTTNTVQTGLTGSKYWTDGAYFSDTVNFSGNTYIGGGSSGAAIMVRPSGTGAPPNSTISTFILPGSSSVDYNIAERFPSVATLNSGANYAAHLIARQTVTENASGTHPLVAQMAIRPLQLNDGTGTTTTYASLYIESGTNFGTAVPDNRYAVWVDAGLARFDGQINLPTSFTPASATDATYPIGTIAADDTYLWYRNSLGNWTKIAWAAY